MKNPVPEDDLALVRASVNGSEPAFRSLVERYEGRVRRLVGRYTRDSVEAEDLAQEVFLKVFRKLHTFQEASSFYTWLYRVAVNTATDAVGRQNRRLRLVEDPIVFSQGTEGDASTPVIEEELREVTRRVLADLPEKYRTILVLREYEDLAYTQIAEVLGCSIGTVESRLFRARKRFKDTLIRRYPDCAPKLR